MQRYYFFIDLEQFVKLKGVKRSEFYSEIIIFAHPINRTKEKCIRL